MADPRPLSPAVREAIIRSVVGSMALSGLDITPAEARAIFARAEREPPLHHCAERDCTRCA